MKKATHITFAFTIWFLLVITGGVIDCHRSPVDEWPYPVFCVIGALAGIAFAVWWIDQKLCKPVEVERDEYKEAWQLQRSQSALARYELKAGEKRQRETCMMLAIEVTDNFGTFGKHLDAITTALDDAGAPPGSILERIVGLGKKPLGVPPLEKSKP